MKNARSEYMNLKQKKKKKRFLKAVEKMGISQIKKQYLKVAKMTENTYKLKQTHHHHH
jgi:hypothetical protein